MIRRSGKQRFSMRWMTGTAMMIAVTIVLGATPLGLIRTPVLTATTLHIPVIIATLALGPEAGVITGFVFGLQSFFNSFTSASFFGPFFINPFVSVFPRVLFPCCVWMVYRMAARVMGKRSAGRTAAYIMSSIIGTAMHTGMVMGLIYLLYAPEIAQMLTAGVAVPDAMASRSVAAGIAAMAVSNAVPEMIVAALIAPAVVLALDKAMGKMNQNR